MRPREKIPRKSWSSPTRSGTSASPTIRWSRAPPYFRLYAGTPLVTASGGALGTLCVLHREPGDLNPAEFEALHALARQTMAQLEWRRGEVASLRSELEKAWHQIKEHEANLLRHEQMQKALRAEHSFRQAVIELAAEGVCVFHGVASHPFMGFTVWNQRMTEVTGCTMDEINRLGWCQSLYPDPYVQQKAVERMQRMREGDDLRFERWESTRADGSKRALSEGHSEFAAH